MGKMIGYGTVIGVSTDTTSASALATYTNIAKIRSASGPSVETAEIEATTFDSTTADMEYILGLREPGDLTFDLAWDPDEASHQLLTDALTDRNLRAWKITLPTTSYVTYFKGLVKSKTPDIPLNGLITSSIGIRTSGGITWPTTTT